MSGPLANVIVLDLSRVLAGPWATQVLADFGATVWKIERPGTGDDTRQWGPPWLSADADEADAANLSAYFACTNRGKHSFEVDLASADGQHIIRQLAAKADILVENYKVGQLAKYGLDYASLKAINPKLIYCSITGFGQDGPRASQPAYDAMIQAMGGIMSLTGAPDTDEQKGEPQKVGVAITDIMTGMYGVSAMLAALHHQRATGEGQYIDLALLDSQVAWLANQASNYLVSGNVPKAMGNAHPNIVPYQSFAVADGHLLLAVGNDEQFRHCCEAMNLPDIANHPDFASNALRVANKAKLVPVLAETFAQQPLDYWIAALNQAKVPCGPINTLDRVFADPQVQHRQMEMHLQHPQLGDIPSVRNPVRFSATPIGYEKAPPLLGQDNAHLIDLLTPGKPE